jgi:small subunit ribosomal protein S3
MDIDYANVFAQTVYGKIGIKVWICRGEILAKRDLNPNFIGGKEGGQTMGERRDNRGDFGGRRDDNRGGGDRRGGGGGGNFNRGGGGQGGGRSGGQGGGRSGGQGGGGRR